MPEHGRQLDKYFLLRVAVGCKRPPKAADEALLTRHMAKQMDGFVESSSFDWQKVYPEKDRRILGALFRFSRLIQSELDGLWVIATEWGINPRLNLGWSEARYMKRLTRALQSGANDRNVTRSATL